jgi:hypothetical protein
VSHSLNGGGVPLTLTNTVFNSAKSMILGSWKIEDEEDEAALMTLYQGDMSKNDSQESQRREAGWIIMEGLIHLGNQWIGTRLSMIFKLLNVSHSRPYPLVCLLQRDVHSDPLPPERPQLHGACPLRIPHQESSPVHAQVLPSEGEHFAELIAVEGREHLPSECSQFLH